MMLRELGPIQVSRLPVSLALLGYPPLSGRSPRLRLLARKTGGGRGSIGLALPPSSFILSGLVSG